MHARRYGRPRSLPVNTQNRGRDGSAPVAPRKSRGSALHPEVESLSPRAGRGCRRRVRGCPKPGKSACHAITDEEEMACRTRCPRTDSVTDRLRAAPHPACRPPSPRKRGEGNPCLAPAPIEAGCVCSPLMTSLLRARTYGPQAALLGPARARRAGALRAADLWSASGPHRPSRSASPGMARSMWCQPSRTASRASAQARRERARVLSQSRSSCDSTSSKRWPRYWP